MDLQVSNDAVGQTRLLRPSIPSGQRSIKERCLCEERQACLLDLERGAVGTLFSQRLNREDRGKTPGSSCSIANSMNCAASRALRRTQRHTEIWRWKTGLIAFAPVRLDRPDRCAVVTTGTPGKEPPTYVLLKGTSPPSASSPRTIPPHYHILSQPPTESPPSQRGDHRAARGDTIQVPAWPSRLPPRLLYEHGLNS